MGGNGKASGKKKRSGGGANVGESAETESRLSQSESNESLHNDYQMNTRGQVTRYEAGLLYKNVKNENVRALPETTKLMYQEADASIKYASRRYSQDSAYYDRIENMTGFLRDGNYRKAQKVINNLEADLINRAGKKSPYYKYKNN